MSGDGIKITGHIHLKFFKDGNLVEERQIPNVITNVGKNELASLLSSVSTGNSLITHFGFGTSTTQESASDTQLGSELSGNGYSRVSASLSTSGNVLSAQGTLTNLSSPVTVTEGGLFNASTGGSLFAHKAGVSGTDSNGKPIGFGSFSFSKTTDALQVTWSISFN